MDTEQLHTQRKLLTEALQDNLRITAIKAIRAMTGAGLMEAKMITDALFDVIGKPNALPTAAQEQSAHYVVISEYPDDTSVAHFRDEGAWNNLNEAMSYAKGKVDVVNDVMVAKVIATTKRTLVTL